MEGPTGEYKPNIYPIMYWALGYGVMAGVLLLVVFLLSRYITVIWFPVFLIGLVWGGYRNYVKQKKAFLAGQGMQYQPQSPMAEFREAARDVMDASREMMAEQAAEDAAALQAEQEAFEAEQAALEEQQNPDQEQRPPQAPTV